MAYSNNQIKLFNSLSIKKYRQKYNLFLVEGDKLVRELIYSNMKIKQLFAVKNWLEKYENLISSSHCEISEVSDKELRKLSLQKNPHQVLCSVELTNIPMTDLLPTKGLHFILDNIQDPGNAGTILRIADWFGFDSVFTTKGTVDLFSPKVVQSSMGALFRIPIKQYEFSSKVQYSPIYIADMHGKSIYSVPAPKNIIIVLSNEGNGVGDHWLQLNNKNLISIPRQFSSQMDSLNVAVTAGILANWIHFAR